MLKIPQDVEAYICNHFTRYGHTMRIISDRVEKHYGLRVSPDSVARLLARNGLRKQPKRPKSNYVNPYELEASGQCTVLDLPGDLIQKMIGIETKRHV